MVGAGIEGSGVEACAWSEGVERDFGNFGGRGGNRGPEVGGSGFLPRVDRFGLPRYQQAALGWSSA